MPGLKKIAIVSAVFPPYRGGIGTVAYHQARLLAERGYEVTVFTPDYGHDHPLPPPNPLLSTGGGGGEKAGEFTLELIKPILKYGNAAWVPGLKNKLKFFDVVVLQYPFFGGAGAVYQAKKKYGFKLVVYYHMDVVAAGGKGLVFKYNTKWFLPRLIKAADLVLASSADYAQHSSLGKYWQPESGKFKVLPIGVDINRFAFSDGPRARMALFVGGLDRAHYFKGVEYLIRAVVLIRHPERSEGSQGLPRDPSTPLRGVYAEYSRPQDDGFKLIIAGKGGLMEIYKKLAQDLGVGDRVEFAGGVSDEELVKLYQKAAVTVLPSIDQSEAFGIVLVEAMACGTPVITSNLPGVRSVYENDVSGLSVPPRDERALAEKISYILDNPEKAREMGKAGRKLVEERNDWEVIGSKLSEIILD